MIEAVGWLGGVLLATCGLPQLYHSIKTKDFKGLSLLFMLWWGLGEVFTMYYVVEKAFRWPLIFNYSINIFVVIVILLYYLKYGVGTANRPSMRKRINKRAGNGGNYNVRTRRAR